MTAKTIAKWTDVDMDLDGIPGLLTAGRTQSSSGFDSLTNVLDSYRKARTANQNTQIDIDRENYINDQRTLLAQQAKRGDIDIDNNTVADMIRDAKTPEEIHSIYKSKLFKPNLMGNKELNGMARYAMFKFKKPGYEYLSDEDDIEFRKNFSELRDAPFLPELLTLPGLLTKSDEDYKAFLAKDTAYGRFANIGTDQEGQPNSNGRYIGNVTDNNGNIVRHGNNPLDVLIPEREKYQQTAINDLVRRETPGLFDPETGIVKYHATQPYNVGVHPENIDSITKSMENAVKPYINDQGISVAKKLAETNQPLPQYLTQFQPIVQAYQETKNRKFNLKSAKSIIDTFNEGMFNDDVNFDVSKPEIKSKLLSLIPYLDIPSSVLDAGLSSGQLKQIFQLKFNLLNNNDQDEKKEGGSK